MATTFGLGAEIQSPTGLYGYLIVGDASRLRETEGQGPVTHFAIVGNRSCCCLYALRVYVTFVL